MEAYGMEVKADTAAPTVDSRLERLAACMTELEESVGRLRERIDGVLVRDESPPKALQVEPTLRPVAPASRVSNVLDQMCERVEASSREVREMVRSVDL